MTATEIVTVEFVKSIAKGEDVYKNNRRKARRVNPLYQASEALAEAIISNRTTIICRNGGDVANAYKYPAETEACLVAASPDGNAVVWMGLLSAKKTTLRGTAETCLTGAGDVFRNGATEKKYDEAFELVLKEMKTEISKGNVFIKVEIDQEFIQILRNCGSNIGIACDYVIGRQSNHEEIPGYAKVSSVSLLKWLISEGAN